MSLAQAKPSAAAGKIPTADELVARARALAPRLRERAVKAERDRNIPPESVEEYIDAGLIHVLQPKRWGGYEHDHEVAFDIAIELGKSTCGSSAWCLNYLADHACILAHFPEEAQHDVWSRDEAACIATSAAPTGKVSVAPGGYRLDGRWSWCSGLRHSQWIMIGGLVFREGEDHPDMRLFLVPVSELKQEDTWYCAGLSATGSNTSLLDNVLVPEHRSVSFSTLRDARSPGSKINTNPIYRTPFIAVHSYALLGPALGVARGGYADFTQWTKARYLTYTQLGIAQHVPVQIAIAEIAAQIDAAELLARRALATARADYAGLSMETRTLLRRDFTFAMKTLRDAMDALIKISGSSGLMDGNSVQRCWRDVHAISSHVVMNWDVPAENFGRTEFGLGLNPAYPMF
ncbi:MAG: 3-hydroxy-9,10-secoandrosta,3,5(10)-triene-9,17-dione monooxygenase [Alphaproteobacteria bacterium]|jgi:3-hydroxy-9,10-secoandrosta-1,3,5(10)-triene-9,17-dione monooxygenase|nr:3-hydroxy-9,10-secoandrosta,3,5(10)-triene-9,17-dione monooxygenase [Alphaproteobacteria bacterium]